MAVISENKGKKAIFWIVILSLLVSLSLISFVKAAEQGVTIRFGTLSDYGKKSISIDGKKVQLCKDVIILDNRDKPTNMGGLVAVETVRVKIKNNCAVEVKALTYRQ